MNTQKVWQLKYVAGNPAMFTQVRADADGPSIRRKAIESALKIAANGWRAWVEHVVTGERIFESEFETKFKATNSQASQQSEPLVRSHHQSCELVMGKIIGNNPLPTQVLEGAKKLADEFYATQEAIDWSGNAVETFANPKWLKLECFPWLPALSHLGLQPLHEKSELVLTAGVDQHIDNYHGLVLMVVLHNDRLKFKQGKVSSAPGAGDCEVYCQ